MKKIVVYIGNFLTPINDAVAKRAVGLGISLQMHGYDFRMIGESMETDIGAISKEFEYNNIKYYNLHRAVCSAEHFRYSKDVAQIKNKLTEWNQEGKLRAVILCGTKCAMMANSIVSFCKKKRILVLADSMDWLSSHTGNRVFDLIKNADTWLEINYINSRVDGIICISSFLSSFYQRKGKHTIVVPPVSPYPKKDSISLNEIPQIVYAGVPCRLDQPLLNPGDAKDRLDIAIELFYAIFSKGIRFMFHVYGLTHEQYIVAFPNQNEKVKKLIDSNSLVFYGRKSESVVRKAIESCDFTILLRNKNRVTQSGFSTKLAESISLGTPVISNDTSDILKYVQDGYDSIIVNIDCFKDMVNRIEKGLLDKQAIERMKHNVLNNTSFSPCTYSDDLRNLIEGI